MAVSLSHLDGLPDGFGAERPSPLARRLARFTHELLLADTFGPHARDARLELDLAGQRVQIHTQEELEFFLAARIEPPDGELAQMVSLDVDSIRARSLVLTQELHTLASVVRGCTVQPEVTSAQLRQLSLGFFTTSQDWRDIFEGLLRTSALYDPFKRATLARYGQFLRNRLSLLQVAYGIRTGSEPQPPRYLAAATGPALPIALAFGEPYEVTHRTAAQSDAPAAKGQPPSVQLLIGEYPFRLTFSARPELVDARNARTRILPGPNTIGRGTTNDIQVDAAFRAVSREHLVIEHVDDDAFLIVDHSLHGTAVHGSAGTAPATPG